MLTSVGERETTCAFEVDQRRSKGRRRGDLARAAGSGLVAEAVMVSLRKTTSMRTNPYRRLMSITVAREL